MLLFFFFNYFENCNFHFVPFLPGFLAKLNFKCIILSLYCQCIGISVITNVKGKFIIRQPFMNRFSGLTPCPFLFPANDARTWNRHFVRIKIKCYRTPSKYQTFKIFTRRQCCNSNQFM